MTHCFWRKENVSVSSFSVGPYLAIFWSQLEVRFQLCVGEIFLDKSRQSLGVNVNHALIVHRIFVVQILKHQPYYAQCIENSKYVDMKTTNIISR